MYVFQSIEEGQTKFKYVKDFLSTFNISKQQAKQQINKPTILVLFRNFSKKYPCEYTISEEEFVFIATCLI